MSTFIITFLLDDINFKKAQMRSLSSQGFKLLTLSNHNIFSSTLENTRFKIVHFSKLLFFIATLYTSIPHCVFCPVHKRKVKHRSQKKLISVRVVFIRKTGKNRKNKCPHSFFQLCSTRGFV